jgi:ribosomal protein S27E
MLTKTEQTARIPASTPISPFMIVVTCPKCGNVELLRDSQLFWAICPTCHTDMVEPEPCPLDNGGD